MIAVLSALFGFMLGSFANVCIVRLPNDASLIRPRSHCPHCRTPIRNIDNIPVISFLMLRGKCRSCGARISWQYPLVELAMGTLFLINGLAWRRDGFRLFIVDVMTFYLLTLSIIDYYHRIIPDELSLSMIGMGLVCSYWNPYISAQAGFSNLLQSFLAALAGGGAMLFLAWIGAKVFKKEALGGGDIKLVAGFGAMLGWMGLLTSVFLGSLFGAAVGILLLMLKKKKRGETLPFGPFLSLGAYAACFLPPEWIRVIFP